MERRNFLYSMGILPFAQAVDLSFLARERFNLNRLGACDWSLGKSSNPEAFDVAKAIGLAGVQVSLGSRSNNMHLRSKDIQAQYRIKSRETGVKITSLAIGELNNFPYKSDSQADQWVSDSIDVAHNLDVNVILLAFFTKNDLRNDSKGIESVIGKLKEVAPKAEKLGITLGIESYLTAEEHLYMMDRIGSKAIKVYYDFRNAQDAGNDICKEIQLLGNSNICELHIKENGKFLGNGDVDWLKVGQILDQINFSKEKWMQLEWSLPDKYDYVFGHQKNVEFLKSIK